MNTVNYPHRKAFTRFDGAHYLLYLGEAPVKYTPESLWLDDETHTEAVAPVDGYSYTGQMADGGTLIAAGEATRGAFISGLIRRRYSDDDVEAILANETAALRNPDDPKAAQYIAEFDEFQAYREECKAIAKEVLSRTV